MCWPGAWRRIHAEVFHTVDVIENRITFSRNQMGIGAASATIVLMTIAAIMIPYLYAELREKK